MYGWMVRMLFKRARRELFSPKKHGFLGLTPVYSETTALSTPYFILKFRVRKFRRKCLFFKKQKVDSTGYYGIVDSLPDLNSKLRLFSGKVRLVSCREPHVVSTKRAITTSEKRM